MSQNTERKSLPSGMQKQTQANEKGQICYKILLHKPNRKTEAVPDDWEMIDPAGDITVDLSQFKKVLVPFDIANKIGINIVNVLHAEVRRLTSQLETATSAAELESLRQRIDSMLKGLQVARDQFDLMKEILFGS